MKSKRRNLKKPKIFISWSESSLGHKRWVENLAKRLRADNINVVWDAWDLSEGHNKHDFMLRITKDPSIKRVLIICDYIYKAKADKGDGGVGVETRIIQQDVLENPVQEKFIPIVREFDENQKPCTPSYLNGVVYINLSYEAGDTRFKREYQKLVRNIYRKSVLKKSR